MPGIRWLELGVRDLERSREFYAGVLGLPEVAAPSRPRGDGLDSAWFDAGPSLLRVVRADGDRGAWVDDDLQAGMRHAGLKVGDVDAAVRRLEAAGVEVLVQPLDVLGDVRIAFFLDPDGARLEYVQGELSYQVVAAPDLVQAEAAAHLPSTAGPRFDHVGVTVPDLDAALEHWVGRYGYRLVGQIRHHDDQRGFLMTYLSAGGSVLEVFSFDVPTHPAPEPDAGRLGLRGIAVSAPAPAAAPTAAHGGMPYVVVVDRG